MHVLHMSEYEALLRMRVARASRKHPVLLEMLADGRLCKLCFGDPERVFEEGTASLERYRQAGTRPHRRKLRDRSGTSRPSNEKKNRGTGRRACSEAGCSAVDTQTAEPAKERRAGAKSSGWSGQSKSVGSTSSLTVLEATITHPTPEGARPRPCRAQEKLVREHGAGSVCSIPLSSGAEVVGALTLEYPPGRAPA